MIMIKDLKNVKTRCFVINLMIQCKLCNTRFAHLANSENTIKNNSENNTQRIVKTAETAVYSRFVMVLHSLTKCECTPHPMCNIPKNPFK